MTSPNKDLQLYDKHPNVKNNGYLRSNIENGSNMDESMGVLLDTNTPPAKPLIVNFEPRTTTRTSIVRNFSFSYIYHDSKIRNRFLLFALVFILFGAAIGAIVVTINDGLVFVQQSKYGNRAICQLSFHADCGTRTKLQEPQPSNHCPRKNGYFKHESDCFRFWQCVNGKAFLNECSHSLAFNEENGNCDWSNSCVTSSRTSQPDGVNNEFVCP